MGVLFRPNPGEGGHGDEGKEGEKGDKCKANPFRGLAAPWGCRSRAPDGDSRGGGGTKLDGELVRRGWDAWAAVGWTGSFGGMRGNCSGG